MPPVQWTREFSNVRNSSGLLRPVIYQHVMYVGACDHVRDVQNYVEGGWGSSSACTSARSAYHCNELKIGSKNQFMINEHLVSF